MTHWQDWFALFLIVFVAFVGYVEMKCPIDYEDATKLKGVEIGDCVKVIDYDGNEFRGTVQQVNGGIIWIYGGDIYWQDYGEVIGHDDKTCSLCLNGKAQCGWPRIETATLDELDPLLDVSFFA